MAMENEKELLQLKNRFRDLANKAFQQNMFTFTGFLGLSEQDALWNVESDLRHAGFTLFGGSEDADRRVVRFGNAEELGYEVPFPIVCVHITPLIAKFADKLSHRDFLGALMNLGIERSTIGDIKVGEKEAYLFCLDSIAEYICDNLDKIKHTSVKCTITDNYEEIPQEEPVKESIHVASERIDVCVAKVYNKSRGDVIELFRAGRVFVNGRLCENNAKTLKENEVVNVRGFGKFIYVGNPRETRKGKLSVEVAIYR